MCRGDAMRRIAFAILLATVAALSLPAVAHAATIHVTQSGNDATGDGSLLNPYASVQVAIDAATPGNDVRVGPGVFPGNVTMRDGVSLHGSGPSWTILQGDLTTSVITAANIGSGETIEGFMIRNGSAIRGGGICCTSSASPRITNNVISENIAGIGGGIACMGNSSPSIDNNTISDNSSEGTGGAIFVGSSTSPSIDGNTIARNVSAISGGGGIYSADALGSDGDGERVPLQRERTQRRRYLHALLRRPDSDNTFVGNSTGMEYFGGAIAADGGAPSVERNVIFANLAGSGGGIAVMHGSSAKISENTIMKNEGGFCGGGVAFYHCLQAPYATFSRNVVSQNSEWNFGGTDAGGGGGIHSAESSVQIIGNTITNNRAVGNGGGIMDHTRGIAMENNVVAGNSTEGTGSGIAVFSTSTAAAVVNNTVVNNNPGPGIAGGIAAGPGGLVNISNCILWGNGDDLFDCVATYSDVEDGDPGTGNISADPSFTDAANSDYTLSASSPCVDAATATAAPASDIRGITRPRGAGVDLGAYEYFDPYSATPRDPTLSSPTHAEGTWSQSRHVVVEISDATSTVWPLAGYAVSLCQDVPESPEESANLAAEATSTSFDAAGDGTWYREPAHSRRGRQLVARRPVRPRPHRLRGRDRRRRRAVRVAGLPT